ncbi:TrkH family potassium uptake protein [Solirubrobacter ginsenosidimutans]|uniref:TrkH family potassium uptake protein n=1 Tax=Solirubrobacter ginsenosidimutans TaxID=490573 RepID=A0A9X3MPD9_9ACTN|nr:TrkH family potassium uptake protein [Solirubrobacter ginsenosidimutans]MDA0160219.1 TrkH family potassium uptake protein [Solirubrobacter ginsenosidimutans]
MRTGIDVGSALDLVGGVLKWLAPAFLAPTAVAIGYGEPFWSFLVAGAITGTAGLALDQITGEKHGAAITPRESFLVVALIWLLVPIFGALPFVLDGGPQLSRPVDAYFETVSGFTATGATLVPKIEELARSMLFWRQLTHWLGGMGIIVLAVAILPRLRIGGRQLLQSELAGPTEIEQLGDTIRSTARRLWRLYVVLTLIAIAVLMFLSVTNLDDVMTPFDAVGQALSVVALGGFSTRTVSIAAFAPITQYVILAFMVIAGINFLRLYRFFVQRRVDVLVKDEELRLYLALIAIGTTLIAIEVIGSGVEHGEAGFRHSLFQATAILTTTGFATTDYALWGPLATLTLLLLMFSGASAGSTGGGIKIVRHLLMFRLVKRELEQTVHREVIVPIRVNRRVVDEKALRSAIVFVLLYLLTFAVGALGLVADSRRAGEELSAFDAFGAAAACLGNVGPAFGFAGPYGSFAPFSDLSTWICTVLMWLGRVEIIPVAVVLTRAYWRA